MLKLLTNLTGILAVIALAACSTPATPTAPAGGASPQPTCDLPETVKDSPDTAAALQGSVELTKATVTAVSARAHVSGCQGAAVTRIDFVMDVTVRDVTAPLQISSPLEVIIRAMNRVAPGLPGDVTVNFESTGQVQTLTFTRDQIQQTGAAGLGGTELLSALGYLARTTGAETCAELPGKQPLPDLTQATQATFDRAGISNTSVVVSVNGVWCGKRFTPRQVEYHVGFGWGEGLSAYEQAVQVGIKSEAVIDTLRDIPQDSLPGDLSPRLVMTTTDWDILMNTMIPLEKATALHDSGLTGNDLYLALGFSSQYLKEKK